MLRSVVQRVVRWPLICVAAVVVLGAVPAAQGADGDPLKLGMTNNADHGTRVLRSQVDVANPAFEAYAELGGIGIFGGSTSGAVPDSVGVKGTGNMGVAGFGIDTGVYGRSTDEVGVLGESLGNFASAVFAHHLGANPGFGVWGQADAGQGVVGIGGASVGDGVEGKATASGRSGVWAHHEGANSGYGLRATATVGVGVLASGSLYGVNGSATTAGGTGIYASNTQSGGYGLRVSGKAGFSRSGVLTLAANATSITKTGVPLTSASYVLATLQTNTAGLFIQGAVPNPAGSSITIYFSKAAPIGTKVAWFVVN
jgi:hypothetical protein